MKSQPFDVVIVGAGISGLAAAYYLKRGGKRVCVVESGSMPGGVIQTELCDGFLLEHGAQSAYARGVLQELIDDLGLSDRELSPTPESRKRFFALPQKDGGRHLIRMPRSIKEILLSPLLSISSKLCILMEPFHRRAQYPEELQDESVAKFITRRFGKQVADRIVATVLAGIWAGDTTMLSARSTFPQLWSYEKRYGSLFLGLIFDYRKRAKQRPRILSFSNGMTELITALVDAIGKESLQLDSSVENIDRDGDNFRLKLVDHQQEILSRSIILTTPANISAKLLANFPTGQAGPSLCQRLSEVYYAPLGVLYLSCSPESTSSESFDVSKFGSGFLSAPEKGRAILGVSCSSVIFRGRAPDGSHLFTCYCGGAANPDLADVRDSSTQQQVINEVQSLMEIPGSLDIIGVSYRPRSIPNYSVGHYLLHDAVTEFHQQNPDIRILGNWLEGIGVSHRVEQAKVVAGEFLFRSSSEEEDDRLAIKCAC